MSLEKTIIENLVNNETYLRKVVPFIKTEYFKDKAEEIIVDEYLKFFNEYNLPPTKEILSIQVESRGDINEDTNKAVQRYIKDLQKNDTNTEWLINETEKFVKEKALFNQILNAVAILNGEDKVHRPEAIPDMMQQALSIAFDSNIGHDYFENAEERWELYNTQDDLRVPFGLEIFDKITHGGLKMKTLNCIIAGTGVGKTIFMCNLASNVVRQGKNVLYITLEMSEEDISQRIDANLLNTVMDEVPELDKSIFLNKINKLQEKNYGSFKVKQFPGGAHAGHFRALIAELKQKKNWKPDLIIIDYLGICGSQKLRNNSNTNTNTYLGSVAVELRNLGVEENVPVFTGAQLNRGGQDNTDVDLTNTADSISTTFAFDLLFSVMAPEELVQVGKYLVKQLKTRYGDIEYYRKFVIGIDKSHMRYYDVEDSAQKNISDQGRTDDVPLFDKSSRRSDSHQFNFN